MLYGAWPAAGPGSHAGALRTAYREHFGPDRLEEELAPFLTETPVLLPAFAAFLRGEPSPPHAEHIGREALFTVFLQVARALALEKPTLLVLEDAHNATSEAREVVATLAHGIETSRVLLLLTERPGGTTAWSAELDRSPHATRLALGRLREQDVRHLLAEALGSAHLAARLAPRLTLLSDGNPLFLFEILQELRRSGTLAATDGDPTWTLRGTLRDVQAPPRLRDLVQARLAGLGTEEREVLDAAATFGFTFDPALLAEVLDRPRLRTLQVLGRLERTHGLVRSRGKHCTFDHHVLQETLYADLPPPLRRATHAAIGEALERGLRETAVDGASAVEACDHFLRADRAASALPWLDAALDHLEEGHLSARAADLMDRVLAVPGLLERSPRARLLLRKAERLRLLGRTADAARTLEEAARMASPKHDPLLASAASTRLADHLRAVGHPDRALAFLTRAIALAQSAGSPKAEAEATCCLGVALDGLGRYAEARDAQRRCLEYAQRARRRVRRGPGPGRSSPARCSGSARRTRPWKSCRPARPCSRRPAVSSSRGARRPSWAPCWSHSVGTTRRGRSSSAASRSRRPSATGPGPPPRWGTWAHAEPGSRRPGRGRRPASTAASRSCASAAAPASWGSC